MRLCRCCRRPAPAGAHHTTLLYEAGRAGQHQVQQSDLAGECRDAEAPGAEPPHACTAASATRDWIVLRARRLPPTAGPHAADLARPRGGGAILLAPLAVAAVDTGATPARRSTACRTPSAHLVLPATARSAPDSRITAGRRRHRFASRLEGARRTRPARPDAAHAGPHRLSGSRRHVAASIIDPTCEPAPAPSARMEQVADILHEALAHRGHHLGVAARHAFDGRHDERRCVQHRADGPTHDSLSWLERK